MCILGCQLDGARTHTLRGEAVPVSDLRPALLAELVSDDAHADAQRRASVPLPHVQEGLLGLEHPHQAPAHPLGREALPVQVVLAAVLTVGQPQQAHARARQRGCVTALAPAVPRAPAHAPAALLSAHARAYGHTLRASVRTRAALATGV